LTDPELIALGFMGDSACLYHHKRPFLTDFCPYLVDVAPGVKRIVDKVKASPDELGSKSSHVPCFAFHFSLTHKFFRFQA
jgi:hypothetical protein